MPDLKLLFLQMAVILATARLTAIAVRFVGQPAVVGEMVAGTPAGPIFPGRDRTGDVEGSVSRDRAWTFVCAQPTGARALHVPGGSRCTAGRSSRFGEIGRHHQLC